MYTFRFRKSLLGAVAALALAACGGGGDSDATGQTHALGDATGSHGEALAASPSWTRTAVLSGTSSSVAAHTPRTVIDAKGRGIAIWQQNDSNSSNHSLWARTYLPGKGWGTARRLESSDFDVNDARIAMDSASGRAMAVWTQATTNGSFYDVWARPYEPASGWGSVKRVESLAGMPQSGTLRVGVDAKGNAVATWTHRVSGSDPVAIMANRYVNGTGWGRAVAFAEPNADGGLASDAIPRLAVTPTGEAIVAWERFARSDFSVHLWSRHMSTTGRWGAAARRVQGVGNAISEPELAIDAKGRALLVWKQIDTLSSGGKRYTVRAKRYAADWASGSSLLYSSTTRFLHNDAKPSVAVNAAGAAVVAWHLADGGLLARVAVASGAWGPLKTLRAASPNPLTELPILGMDNTGKTFAMWGHWPSGARPDVLIRRYLPSTGTAGSWGSTVRLDSSIEQSGMPALAVSANGSALALWQENPGGGWPRVLGRHYGSVH